MPCDCILCGCMIVKINYIFLAFCCFSSKRMHDTCMKLGHILLFWHGHCLLAAGARLDLMEGLATGSLLLHEEVHMRRGRSRGTENKTCQLCGKIFRSPAELERHMTTHTGARPFTCDVCGKGFTRKASVLVHKSSVHKDALEGHAHLPHSSLNANTSI